MDERVSIYEEKVNERTVYIDGEITQKMASYVIKDILSKNERFEAEGVPLSERKIVFIINSNGGDVGAGLAIYDMMRYIGCKIITVAVGHAFSMAAILLAAGDERYSMPNAEIMVHQPISTGIAGQATEIELYAEHISKLKERLNIILSKHTGRSIESIYKDTERDRYFTPEEALKYGLVDSILHSRKELEL